jgi:hypothetical protein
MIVCGGHPIGGVQISMTQTFLLRCQRERKKQTNASADIGRIYVIHFLRLSLLIVQAPWKIAAVLHQLSV